MHRLSGAGTPPSQPPTDPDYAPTSEVFDHLTHTEIQRGVQQLNPEVLTAGQQTWQGSANSVADAVQAAHAEIRGAIADGWRGGAAQTAADAVAAFEKYGQHLSDVMAVVGQRLGQANGAAETLRSAVSQQGVEHANLEAALLDPSRATANVAVQKGAENLRQDAVRVMDTVYTGVFLAAGKDVPAFMDGGIYPDHPAPQAGPADPNAPGGGSSDLVGAASGSVPGGPEASAQAGPAASARATHDGHTGEHPGAGERQRTDRPAEARPDAVAPAAATVPSAVAPMSPVATPEPVAGTVAAAATSAPEVPVVAPATVNSTVAQPKPAASEAAGGAPYAPRPVASGSGRVPVGVNPAGVSAAAGGAASTTAASSDSGSDSRGGASDKHDSAEHDSDRHDDQNQGHNGTDAITGMGAGMMGGLAGGVFVAGDTARSSSMPMPPKPVREDEDEYDGEEYYDEDDLREEDEEPTFLEPAEPATALVGQLEPTTPPVLGEWPEGD